MPIHSKDVNLLIPNMMENASYVEFQVKKLLDFG